MYLVVERLIFENGFPSLATRAVWNRRCLINACSFVEQSTGPHAQHRYSRLLQRLKTDTKYVQKISKLVSVYTPEYMLVTLRFLARCPPSNYARQSQDDCCDACHVGI
jgi:hypothetical protein